MGSVELKANIHTRTIHWSSLPVRGPRFTGGLVNARLCDSDQPHTLDYAWERTSQAVGRALRVGRASEARDEFVHRDYEQIYSCVSM